MGLSQLRNDRTVRSSKIQDLDREVRPMAHDKEVTTAAPAATAPATLAAGGQGGALAPIAKPKSRRSIRSLILPAIVLAAVGYGGTKAYDWFVNGRFLVSTDDAYVGADTAVMTAKVAGHVALV